MSTIIFLTNEDFELKSLDNINYLFSKMKGISVVLFYSTKCKYCEELIPTFKRLPKMVQNVQFGMLNVNLYNLPIQLSKNSIDQIKYVPYIMFYSNGKPIIRYSGDDYQIEKITRFVTDVAKQLSSQAFHTKPRQEKKDIPSYTIGMPYSASTHKKTDETYLCKAGVCYLDDCDAYKKS